MNLYVRNVTLVDSVVLNIVNLVSTRRIVRNVNMGLKYKMFIRKIGLYVSTTNHRLIAIVIIVQYYIKNPLHLSILILTVLLKSLMFNPNHKYPRYVIRVTFINQQSSFVNNA